MLVASIWSFFLLPETKGLTIDQMDVVLYVDPDRGLLSELPNTN
jgi:hypothetical protein